MQHPCKTCGTVDRDKPQCFRGTDWCCENHRKQQNGEKVEVTGVQNAVVE